MAGGQTLLSGGKFTYIPSAAVLSGKGGPIGNHLQAHLQEDSLAKTLLFHER